jgi:hypothetical protein
MSAETVDPNTVMHINGGPATAILRKQSSYKVGVSNASIRRSDKKITFADDHGEVISEDFFVEHLHYSPSSMTAKMDGPKGCCVLA